MEKTGTALDEAPPVECQISGTCEVQLRRFMSRKETSHSQEVRSVITRLPHILIKESGKSVVRYVNASHLAFDHAVIICCTEGCLDDI